MKYKYVWIKPDKNGYYEIPKGSIYLGKMLRNADCRVMWVFEFFVPVKASD